MYLYEEEPIGLSYRLIKFSSHRHYGSEDITLLVCQVTLEDHVIKVSCDFMRVHQGKFSSCQVHV